MSPLEHLLSRTGHYGGRGITQDAQPFAARFALQPLLAGRAVELRFRATDPHAIVTHEEVAWITAENLHSIHSHLPEILTYTFAGRQPELGAREGFVFRHGQSEERQTFRAEICIGLYANGDIGYRVSWGEPGEELKFRSSVRLRAEA